MDEHTCWLIWLVGQYTVLPFTFFLIIKKIRMPDEKD